MVVVAVVVVMIVFIILVVLTLVSRFGELLPINISETRVSEIKASSVSNMVDGPSNPKHLT